jgi:uncharacterized damage-inducible protein DinB
MKQLLETLENSRKYTLSVAERMPQDFYQFKPVDTIWNFGELLNHIAYGIDWWKANYIKGQETAWNPPAAKTGKEEVLSSLQKAYDDLRETISRKESSLELMKGFHATLDHITHHRGQAIVYLRCKGLTPPEYIF